MDKFAFTPVENKFEFVRAVEKKIVKIRSTDEITAEVLKHFCGSQGPIYIRSTTDLTALLTNQNLLKQDPNSYEATTITTTQSSNTVSAAPESSMIAFVHTSSYGKCATLSSNFSVIIPISSC